MQYTETDIELAMRAHDCTRDDAISQGHAERIAGIRATQRAEYEATQYQRSRSAEYPPITDYLDGVVKGDQAQIDAYIAACQAVKAKYPKPESN